MEVREYLIENEYRLTYCLKGLSLKYVMTDIIQFMDRLMEQLMTWVKDTPAPGLDMEFEETFPQSDLWLSGEFTKKEVLKEITKFMNISTEVGRDQFALKTWRIGAAQPAERGGGGEQATPAKASWDSCLNHGITPAMLMKVAMPPKFGIACRNWQILGTCSKGKACAYAIKHDDVRLPYERLEKLCKPGMILPEGEMGKAA